MTAQLLAALVALHAFNPVEQRPELSQAAGVCDLRSADATVDKRT